FGGVRQVRQRSRDVARHQEENDDEHGSQSAKLREELPRQRGLGWRCEDTECELVVAGCRDRNIQHTDEGVTTILDEANDVIALASRAPHRHLVFLAEQLAEL